MKGGFAADDGAQQIGSEEVCLGRLLNEAIKARVSERGAVLDGGAWCSGCPGGRFGLAGGGRELTRDVALLSLEGSTLALNRLALAGESGFLGALSLRTNLQEAREEE